MKNIHTFHIPVLGLAFSIDTPIKVARFGISSVISIVEDKLIELMRKHYYPIAGKTYFPISTEETDYRAKRITDYLNLVNEIVELQLVKLKMEQFVEGSEIVKYFEMLANDHELKRKYVDMCHMEDGYTKLKTQDYLRTQIRAGSIDVNIMTKVDKDQYDLNGNIIEDGSDAVSALRGYAHCNLRNSSIVFSAGMNPRVYNYLLQWKEFDIDENGTFNKKIVIKVSDFRSALIQGKYLAKKGLWVSEYRIESGLNCGGHAFATDGYLLGPILEEFKRQKEELIRTIFEIYNEVLKVKYKKSFKYPPNVSFSVQGGIGTYEEQQFLLHYYQMDSIGWGTPFLLVPEATTVDDVTLNLLSNAKKEDICLSNNSPLGIRFHYLKGTTSEMEKNNRIHKKSPGSPCIEKHLAFNTEFTKEPICVASKKYQKLKLAQLNSFQLSESDFLMQVDEVLAKECLCVGLSNSAAINYNIPFIKNLPSVTICPGPNIVNFSKVVNLETMVSHIYGRLNIISNNERPNMFLAEINLYIDFIREQFNKDLVSGQLTKRKKYYDTFFANLLNGIEYYINLAKEQLVFSKEFTEGLKEAHKRLEILCLGV
ncbi:MAG: hypothetical protein IPL09_04335 [Bacteroidetes bacterium]|jgi:hypothetical protein|nr:hypothetical protein [Bacteroidota bacterium]MBK8328700.1 hypothetical protein [Bacteroidota bacterium]MBK9302011.1 hypothetical protein [Bacteroidota bacterium]MBK9481578.1 hypothetical protein [Bacteroidota bacterium]